MNRYSKFTFRAGEEVLYEEQATAADAQKLAESLEKARIFDGKGEKTVVLVKNTNGAIISFVISENSANTPATIDAFRKFGQELEAGGFDKHVVIRFCDRNLKLLREIR